jgi:glycosyltransferase involved in cell wall biosynthesis
MSVPRVSIIVPCYNQAHLLPDAVASAIAQSFHDWELIIVDDQSPDETAQVAQALIAAHPGHAIRLLRQSNTGLAGARNAGIQAARGDIIMPLDADDCLMPDLLEQAVAVFDTHPLVGFVYGDVELFGGEVGRVVNRPYDRGRMRFTCLLHAMSPFRRVAWEQAGGYRTSMGRGYEDWDFWLSLAELGWEGRYLPRIAARYRRTDASKLTRDRQYDLELRALLIHNHPPLYPAAFRRWAGRVLSPAWSIGDAIQPHRWWAAFAWYNLLIARHAPQELPRTLLRPLYWRLPAWAHTPLRQLARRLLR